jgi:phage-related tail fiber protein
MSTFGGVHFTNKGKLLQAKALTGVQLSFTRLAVGDGSLTGQVIADLSALIHEVKTLPITTLKNTNDGKVTIGGVLTNQGLVSGFYWRELGLFATDPDLGEILYCYGNAAALAEYISAGGGADILEKQINIVAIVGDATNISAVINSSLVHASYEDLIALDTKVNNLTAVATSNVSPVITKPNDIWFKILQ